MSRWLRNRPLNNVVVDHFDFIAVGKCTAATKISINTKILRQNN